MEEGQALARQTQFGVVGCLVFDKCTNKHGGQNCADCTRNKYSQTKVADYCVDLVERRQSIMDALTDAVDKLTEAQLRDGSTLLLTVDIKRVKLQIGVVDNIAEAARCIEEATEHLNRAGTLIADVATAQVR